MKFFKILVIALSFSKFTVAQSLNTIPLDSGKNTSIRGISVVDDKVAWISGSNGWIAKTKDAKTFEWQQLKGYEKIDFRDIEAFSDTEAIIVSAGSPAYILKTINAGISWQKVYENRDTSIFLDGMAFWNKKEGIIFGDPIDGVMQILITKDGGNHWENISDKANIQLIKGEAGFAASGTGIRTFKNKVYIATGGIQSRLFISPDKGKTWSNEKIPIIQGESSTGCFSIAVNDQEVFAVGGDYLKDQSIELNYAKRENSEWIMAEQAPNGYKSSIEMIGQKTLIATGTSGTDISTDGGINWQMISSKSFNVCQKAKKGKLILLAGSKGQISKLKLNY
ncbi:MAG: oxidoreductase [Pelobium sp.]